MTRNLSGEATLVPGTQVLSIDGVDVVNVNTLAGVEEMCVCDIAAAVEMTPQAVSNQLQRLADQKIVATRRAGNMIYYRLIDDCVVGLLQKAICLLGDIQTK